VQSSMADPPLAPPGDTSGYHIEFDVCDGCPTLTLVGDLDAAATDALRGILSCVEDAPGAVHVDAHGVLGVELDAFDPLFEFARERHARQRPGVVVDALSEAVKDLFTLLTLPVRPPVELADAARLAS
jgi:hypothetical protein